jgi:type I restriction enzyme S subunit
MIPKERRLGWQYWEVADLIREGVLVIGDGYRAKNSEMGKSGLPFARAGNLNNGFHFEDSDILSEERVFLAGEKISKPGDITFTSKGTFGRFAIVRDNTPQFVYSPQLCYWRVKREGIVDRTYLYYWMQGEDCMNQLNEVKGLTDMAEYVSLTNQRRMWLSAPPLPEQMRIAGILSAYDELIENSQRRIRILESMARALYCEWFVHFRFPGHENHPRVSSPLGEIPQGWEVKKLGEIAENMRRNVPKGKLEKPLPYVGLEHIPRRSLALDAWEIATELGSNKLEFKKGEILFGKIRPYFHKVSVAPFDGLCSADTIVIRARCPEHYAAVVACVSSDAFVAEASATSNGAKMPRANWDVLEKYHVAIPQGKVAAKFSELLADIIAQQQTMVFQIQNLRRTRDLLLPRLLSGQMVLNNSLQ